MSLTKGIGMGMSGAATGTMIAPGIGTAIGAGIGLLGGLLSDDGSDEAAAKLKQAEDLINSLEIPEIDKAIALQQFQQLGTFSPELLEKIELEADKKTTLREDPQNRANQQMAINALKELSQTGMSAIDRAQMAEMRSQVAQDLQAKNAQIAQEAQMRGQSGGGQELAQKLMSSQAGAQQASKDAMQQAAAAAQARQNALAQFGSMAGQVRSADVGTQQFNIQNEVQRQRFLDQNSLARQQANISATNQARMMNLQRQQQIGDMNVQAANQELARQRQAQYQKFQADLAKKSAIANIYGKQASLALGQAESEAENMKSIFSGVGQLAGAGKDAGWWGKTPTVKYDTNTGTYSQPIGPGLPSNWSHGGRIPGKANISGDSHENDVVPAMLSPDEIVVPRSKANSPKKAKSFIDEIFEQERLDKKQKKGYDKNESILDLIAKLHSEKSK